MLVPTKTLSAPPFIVQTTIGKVTNGGRGQFALVQFDPIHYQDALFEYFGLHFPPALYSAVDKRRAEFLAGRYAAQLLLQKEGCYEAVPIQEDRSPQWPKKWRGSISHTKGHAIAIVVPSSSSYWPGVDIEHLPSFNVQEIANSILTSKEQRMLSECGLENNLALLLAFSVKESLYKALFPLVRRFFGFEAAEIYQVDLYQQKVSLRLTQMLSPLLPAGTQLTGYYQIYTDYFITFII